MRTVVAFIIITLSGWLAACQANGGNNMKAEQFFSGQALELAHAIDRHDSQKIDDLIKNGADPNIIGREGMTLLIYAIGHKNKEALRTLLKNGADPNMRINTEDAIESVKGDTAVMFIAGAPDNEYLEILLDHGGDVNAVNGDGEPILIRMILEGSRNYEGMRMLLDRGADINAVDSGGYPLIKILANLNDFEHVYYLLERGANFKIKSIARNVYQEKIDSQHFPEAAKWQKKCQDFLRKNGVPDPGPRVIKEQTPEEDAEYRRKFNEAKKRARQKGN